MKLYLYDEIGDSTGDCDKVLIGDFPSSDDLIDRIRQAHPEAKELVVIATRPDEALDDRLWIIECDQASPPGSPAHNSPAGRSAGIVPATD